VGSTLPRALGTPRPASGHRMSTPPGLVAQKGVAPGAGASTRHGGPGGTGGAGGLRVGWGGPAAGHRMSTPPGLVAKKGLFQEEVGLRRGWSKKGLFQEGLFQVRPSLSGELTAVQTTLASVYEFCGAQQSMSDKSDKSDRLTE